MLLKITGMFLSVLTPTLPMHGLWLTYVWLSVRNIIVLDIPQAKMQQNILLIDKLYLASQYLQGSLHTKASQCYDPSHSHVKVRHMLYFGFTTYEKK